MKKAKFNRYIKFLFLLMDCLTLYCTIILLNKLKKEKKGNRPKLMTLQNLLLSRCRFIIDYKIVQKSIQTTLP